MKARTAPKAVPMTIWDVIPDPGLAVASMLDPDFPPGARRIPMPRRGRRTLRLFDLHPDEFPIQEAVAIVEEEPPAPPPPKPKKPRKVKFSLPASEVAYVKDAIQAILPKGVPSYVKEILYIGRVPRSKSRRLAEIVLWDGGIGRLEISGEPGAHGYHWKTTGGDGRPFHWDEAAGKWARVDEPEAD